MHTHSALPLLHLPRSHDLPFLVLWLFSHLETACHVAIGIGQNICAAPSLQTLFRLSLGRDCVFWRWKVTGFGLLSSAWMDSLQGVIFELQFARWQYSSSRSGSAKILVLYFQHPMGIDQRWALVNSLSPTVEEFVASTFAALVGCQCMRAREISIVRSRAPQCEDHMNRRAKTIGDLRAFEASDNNFLVSKHVDLVGIVLGEDLNCTL